MNRNSHSLPGHQPAADRRSARFRVSVSAVAAVLADKAVAGHQQGRHDQRRRHRTCDRELHTLRPLDPKPRSADRARKARLEVENRHPFRFHLDSRHAAGGFPHGVHPSPAALLTKVAGR
jgi:hypothetical protein